MGMKDQTQGKANEMKQQAKQGKQAGQQRGQQGQQQRGRQGQQPQGERGRQPHENLRDIEDTEREMQDRFNRDYDA
ncbi:hypothetical protein [Streptomyces camelliae]|uniref:CsbD family protein n=1 Tax=Streptomyces camelliae TaxID=3004093 RepID=A0ABY7P7V6_9ACTN|nr:hypothetical protein [Streptomyces sp. HUAS 2-6]WBO65757.1 hypothetical protein O1G22_24555 [Streptomyces sp. HUAS 2-6]